MNRLQSCIRPWDERVSLGPSWNPRIESQSVQTAFKARRVIGLLRFGTDTFAMTVISGKSVGGKIRLLNRRGAPLRAFQPNGRPRGSSPLKLPPGFLPTGPRAWWWRGIG